VTALEVYELTTRGGGSDFGRVIQACESLGSYCLIGGLAVNTYVDPVYTLDADIVVIASSLPLLTMKLREQDFVIESHAHPVNAQSAGSDLRIQFTTDDRYQEFPSRAVQAEVLGLPVRVACLEDVTRGKLWAYGDPARRLSKRKKDELDLIRLGEAYPKVRSLFPAELLQQLEAE
jgi:hypothetical protein